MASTLSLLDLPPELLSILFSHLHTETFVHFILTCKQLFDLARSSRDILSYHIERLPGIKLGLDARTISTSDLFLLVRQRASQNLVGAGILANRRTTKLRSMELNPSASCLAASGDYFNGCLAMQNSLTIRHCTTNCSLLQEAKVTSPYSDGRAKVVQVVQSKNSVSTLYAWKPDKSDHIVSCPNTPSLHSIEVGKRYDAAPAPAALGNIDDYEATQYHLFHHNAYCTDRAVFFHVSFPYKHWREKGNHFPDIGEDFEPIHLAVHQRRMCVVVWRPGSKSKVLSQTQLPTVVVLYRADDVPRGYAGHYTSTILLHTTARTSIPTFSSDYQIRATAFCDNGKSLKLYQPGSIVPCAMIRTLNISNGTMRRPEPPNQASFNEITLEGYRFRADTIFHSSHRFHTTRNVDTGDTSTYCTLGCLSLVCLTKDDRGNKKGRWQDEDTLFIMQSADTTNDAVDCDHEEVQNGDTCIADRRYNSRIVARLRGLDEHWPLSNLVGLDTLCTSQKGTRISIACWDKILVWVLDPSVLVEPWDADEDKSQAESENGDQSDNSNTASTGQQDLTAASAVSVPSTGFGGPLSVLSVRSQLPTISKRAMVKATRYYELTDDPDFGEIVELWPQVLPLPEGMVARKMMWPVVESRTFAEVYEENSEDSLRASDSEEDSADGTEQGQHHNEDDEEIDDGASSLGSDGQPQRPRTLVGDSNLLVNDPQLRLENMLQEYLENSRKIEAGEEVEPAPENENEYGDPMGVDATGNTQQSNGAARIDKGKEPELPFTPEEIQKEDELVQQLLIKKANEEWGGVDNQPRQGRKRNGEDKLVVMTDRGLVKWDLGPRAKRRWVMVDVVVSDGEEGVL